MKKKLLLSTTILIIYSLSTSKCFSQTIAAGAFHSTVLCNDNTVQAFGNNSYGQLGNGTFTDSNIPIQVTDLTGINKLAAGLYHSLALKNDGTVWAWGYNNSGQLGNGTFSNSNIPIQISSLASIIAIASGWSHSLALKNDGTVWAWGRNSSGQLGNGDTINSSTPIQVSSLIGITAIAAGSGYSFALKNDGTVWAWGHGSFGELGNGSFTNSSVPIQDSSLSGVIAIAGGAIHSLALKSDGTVWAWGYNNYGQLGNGTYISGTCVPLQDSSLSNVSSIAAGFFHSLAVKNDGTVWAWGSNSYGELGLGYPSGNAHAPLQVSIITDIVSITGGHGHSLAQKNDGTLLSFGKNSDGQLGNGSYTDSNVPAQVMGLCPVANAINEVAEHLFVSVSPNPSNGRFQIQTNNSLTYNYHLSILNVFGQNVFKTVTNQLNKLTIDLSGNPTGIYLIQIFDENKNVVNKKIVLQ